MIPKTASLLLLPLLLLPFLSAAEAPGPRVVVLGTVQDGGMPQTGCDCTRCAAART